MLAGKISSAPFYTDPMLNLTYGKVAVFDQEAQPDRMGVEYRFRTYGSWKLIPAIGFARANGGATFAYTDIRHDFWLSPHWLLIPSFGAGVFSESERLKLGNTLEFRSGIEWAYRFDNDYRLGLALFHLSNGGLSRQNPGTEALVLSLCIPVLPK